MWEDIGDTNYARNDDKSVEKLYSVANDVDDGKDVESLNDLRLQNIWTDNIPTTSPFSYY